MCVHVCVWKCLRFQLKLTFGSKAMVVDFSVIKKKLCIVEGYDQIIHINLVGSSFIFHISMLNYIVVNILLYHFNHCVL